MTDCPTRTRLNRAASLRQILNAGCSVVEAPRILPPALAEAASLCLAAGPRLVLARGPLEELRATLAQALPAQAMPLSDDILNLAETYRDLTGHQELRLRLERITGDSCRKFHVDCVGLRLLCTYKGPAVQWTKDGGVTIHEAGTGAVVLLKGKHFANWSEADGVLHRSPPLSGHPRPETARLLLTLDEVDACGADPAEKRLIAA
ncbi:DUF1826 domain-containing protein [Acidocella sp.]|uniref:DUF1826 domain-containing protein n=1 Tax=Acidocella sp. TaxID=50710 RepID=UPI003D02A3C6